MTRAIAAALLALTGMTTAAVAESPVAIVEDISGKVTGAELMDYLLPRAVIKLGDNSAITLSYLKSCRRETITGLGTVIVGTEESSVHLANLKSEKTPCDAARAGHHARDERGRGHDRPRSGQRRRLASSDAVRCLTLDRGERPRRTGDRAS